MSSSPALLSTSQPSPLWRWDQEHDACGVGFVAKLTGERSYDVVKAALTALKNLGHRGAIDADAVTGDGAGILTQIPTELFRDFLQTKKINLYRDSDLGVGMIFLPKEDTYAQSHAKRIVESAVKAEGLAFLGWREVPVNNECLGRKALATEPAIVQALVGRTEDISEDAFERKLFLAQKVSENKATEAGINGFYICSFSSRTIVYKGLFNSVQVNKYYRDLRSTKFTTAFAIFHQRYSTNTFPTWHLAQPFRHLAHNGEINTVRGNRNLMRARERSTAYGVWGERFADLRPIIQPNMSDSASFDNVLQTLILGGRSALEAMTIMMPPAWEKNKKLSEEVRSFYRYHSCMMEPWDGPAAMCFTDGRYIAAALDRNGLRPARFKIYEDGTVICASEAGLIPDTGKTRVNGKLGPGRMIAIDLQEKRFMDDTEIRALICARPEFKQWCDRHLIDFSKVPKKTPVFNEVLPPSGAPSPLLTQQLAFGFDADELELLLTPMATKGLEPTGAMGDDTPLAVLSRRPRLLYTYFKQLFAQVTNPPIDSIREKSVMSLTMWLGGRLGLFEDMPANTTILENPSPILFDHEVAALFDIPQFQGKIVRLSAHFDPAGGPGALEPALRELAGRARTILEEGQVRILILSDRGVEENKAAIPMLLAVGAVNQELIRAGVRLRSSIIIETGEPREVHHIACLLGYGATAVNPYLTLATVREIAARQTEPIAPEKAMQNYRSAIESGLLKIMAKMGISTLSSYRGAQIFEAIGISESLIEECFFGTPTPIGGIGYIQIAEEALARHYRAYPKKAPPPPQLSEGPAPMEPAKIVALESEGYLRPHKRMGQGEFHAWNPHVIAGMHKFLRSGAQEEWEKFQNAANNHPPVAIKDLLKFRFAENPVPLNEVEPMEDIRRRFTTAGMSLGALSPEAHEALAIAMNRIGGKSNSGEGGEDSARFSPMENGDCANSAIKQVASARFGVTAEYLASAKEIEIKISQGAKPGEGGQLPGHKVSALIARLRHSTPGITLISPPPHHDIYSIEDLAQLIFDLKEVNPRAKVCVKLVSCSGVGTVAAGVAKAYADVILVSGHEGGTGASPLSSIKNAGSAWEIGLAEAHQVLMMNGLRNRVVLRTDGGMKTGRDIVIAAILGAEEYNFGTAALIAAGCAMFRVCHLNTCPVGVATQREDLRAKFKGKPESIVAYFNAVAEDVRSILSKLGARTLNDIIGRTELLEQIDDPSNPKTKFINLAPLLHNPDPSGEMDRIHTRERNERFGFEGGLDELILQDAKDVINGKSARLIGKYKVTNEHRCVGTQLSGEIAYLRGNYSLPPGTIDLSLTGVAGQSLGAFLVQGIRIKLAGEANDYVGKCMAGGEIIVRPKDKELFAWHHNIIIGNTCLYGATGGYLFAAGRAGERFAVRNSGATAVVEGVGDHGCEYMTNGTVVVLGPTGDNFGAGMSGGLAFVYDVLNEFEQNYNPGMVSIERLNNEEEIQSLKMLIELHWKATSSPWANTIIMNWATAVSKFWKVVPHPPQTDWPRAYYSYDAAKVPVLA
jgi:glutamate synthase (NADPH/NADH) large chain/glutamate synthase (ferredoxin)